VLNRKEEGQAIVPLLLSQDAKLELLSQQLDRSYLDLGQSGQGLIEADFPEEGRPGKTRKGAKGDDGRSSKKPGFFRRYFG
jgi:hypothetical protein